MTATACPDWNACPHDPPHKPLPAPRGYSHHIIGILRPRSDDDGEVASDKECDREAARVYGGGRP